LESLVVNHRRISEEPERIDKVDRIVEHISVESCISAKSDSHMVHQSTTVGSI
jgi:hypothetical protein